MIEALAKQMPSQEERRMQGEGMTFSGTGDDLVTTRVDIHEHVRQKRYAFRAHSSQNDPSSWFATMPEEIYEIAFGTEHFQLARGSLGTEPPEPDLFAGID